MKISRNVLMLSAACLLAAGLAASTANSASNPLIRLCTINSGNFETYPQGTDDMALCRWNQVIIDSQTLVSNVNGVDTLAGSTILSDVTSTDCATAGLSQLTIPTGETLCLFSDGSKMSEYTLKAGLSDADRLHLKDVLLAR